MPHARPIQVCDRCRQFKRRCDKRKPQCSNCAQAGFRCSLRHVSHSDISGASSNSTLSISASPTTDSSSCTDGPKEDVDPRDGPLGDVDSSAIQKPVKRRDRAIKSCIRCHRLKIKCDKKQPCARCLLAGTDCSYTQKGIRANQAIASAPPSLSLAEEDPHAVVTSWFARQRGNSHWRALLSRIDSLSRQESNPFVQAVNEHIIDLANCPDTQVGAVLPGNFPFGSPGAVKYASLDAVHSLIKQSEALNQVYIDHYLEMHQPVCQIVSVETWNEEVAEFRRNPNNVSVEWIAQYLMVVGLGAFSMTQDPLAGVEYCLAAEACLAKTPFMFRPSILTLKTMCLMLVAKQIANTTCWALDSCWSLLGLIVRLGVMEGLHLGVTHWHCTPAVDSDSKSRRRLWTTILYFDISMSLVTGMSSLSGQYENFLPSASFHEPGECHPMYDSSHCILLRSFPIVYRFLERINSKKEEITYEEVQEYDSVLRGLMAVLPSIPGNNLLRITMDIFFRRVLLVLHRYHALHSDAPNIFPLSYWSSLECSLALLVHNGELCDNVDNPNNFDLFARPFMLDFFSAALTASIHLLRSDAPLAASAPGMESDCPIPPRQTILDTLKSCKLIWARTREKSLCSRAGTRFIGAILEMMPESASPI